MDQFQPEEIARIVITPPASGTRSPRGWGVQAFERHNLSIPAESYACTDADRALDVAEKLLAGVRVCLADCVSPVSESGGRPHATR